MDHCKRWNVQETISRIVKYMNSYPSNNSHFWIKSKSKKQSEIANCQSSSGGFSSAQDWFVKLGKISIGRNIDILDNFRGEKQPRIPNWNLFFVNCQNESAWICATHVISSFSATFSCQFVVANCRGVWKTIPLTSLTLPGYAASLLSLLGH